MGTVVRLSGVGIICKATGWDLGEKSVPLVSQWATVSQTDLCDDKKEGGSAGLSGGPKLLDLRSLVGLIRVRKNGSDWKSCLYSIGAAVECWGLVS